MQLENISPPSKAIKQEVINNQIKLIKTTGFDEKFIHFDFLTIDPRNNTQIQYLTIDKVKRDKSNVLVMIHGFGGSMMSFFKTYKSLADSYHIIALDLPGTNLNSRTKEFPFDSTQTCLDYFIDQISKFIDVLKLKKFFILGHSLGAYLSSHYMRRYPKKVLKFVAVSPGGFNMAYDDQKQRSQRALKRKFWFPRRWAMSYAFDKIFGEKKSAFEIFWKPSFWMINWNFKRDRYNFTKD